MIPVSTMYVSSNYFSTLGVTLPRGPGFAPVDDASRAEPEAVIGHRVWQTRFGSDPDVIGRPITINQTEYVIVGVTPEGFRGHEGGLELSSGRKAVLRPLRERPRFSPRGRLPWRRSAEDATSAAPSASSYGSYGGSVAKRAVEQPTESITAGRSEFAIAPSPLGPRQS